MTTVRLCAGIARAGWLVAGCPRRREATNCQLRAGTDSPLPPRPRGRLPHDCTGVVLAACAVLLLTASALDAQVPTGERTRDTVRQVPPPQIPLPPVPGAPQPGERAAADTAVADTVPLVRWPEPDSVEQELLARSGFVATRYRGETIVFDARRRTIQLEGGPGAVAREQTLLVGDTIFYDEDAQLVVLRGDTVILRDPLQHADDVVARGMLTYDIARGRGAVTNISTAMMSGERWFVEGRVGLFARDTAGLAPTTFFVRHGIFTTCDEVIPDYHFRAREIKLITRNFIVARPATLYIGEVPVMWLPFMFQDIRSGRRSGFLSPRLGFSELVRSGSRYRRQVDNLGYYFALNDYADAQLWFDWRSGARETPEDPGWIKWHGDVRYRWLNRFLTGNLGVFHLADRAGRTNTGVSWNHRQDFSQSRRLTTQVNYVTSTALQYQNTFDPRQVLGTIRSNVNYQQQIGPVPLSLGGSRTQYPGRQQVEQTFPNLSLLAPTIALARWLEWTPNLQLQNQQTFNIDQPGLVGFRYIVRDGVVDSVLVSGNRRETRTSFSTPLKIFGWTWNNSFSMNDRESDFPTPVVIVNPEDPTERTTRVFARTFQTGIDWETGIQLPSFFGGTWNLSPGINLRNVDPGPFWVRSQFTGGNYVRQNKRLEYTLGIAPTFYGLFPGVGPLTRIRHAISPRLSYNYAAQTDVDPEYLRAINRSPADYLGNLARSQLTLHVSHAFEGRLASDDTTTAPGGQKLRLLSMNFSPLTYDFERARATGGSGFTTDRFSYDLASDLLPGLALNVGYSLFQGSTLSDTAVFKPFRESISASFSFNQQSAIFSAIGRVFGRPMVQATPAIERLEPAPDDALAQRLVATPVAGSMRRDRELALPTAGAWQATFAFSSQRQRPPVGDNIIDFDPLENCRGFIDNPLAYQTCINEQQTRPIGHVPFDDVIGAPFIRMPSRETLQWNMNFHITPKWAAQWGTTYDFRASEFASHDVTLMRELHDWRTNFSFQKAPNGNFSFMFFISLIAQPDLKFDYKQHTYRRPGQ